MIHVHQRELFAESMFRSFCREIAQTISSGRDSVAATCSICMLDDPCSWSGMCGARAAFCSSGFNMLDRHQLFDKVRKIAKLVLGVVLLHLTAHRLQSFWCSRIKSFIRIQS